ncbi:LysR family transcriptional regulator [Microbacterium sp. JZ31]|uniref:LysR family transcriptional regulator n=1 Tax=Microbacterium sp. JZ31 TaxID=1906274 RepID=UPI001931364A|nr:LysR family transcriptional regulator [Microbacterium sp. JZ31]
MSHRSPDGLDRLPLWRTFLAVHASGSLSGAARTLGLTQPAVTAQLQALEAMLEEQLFERSARGVTPTPRADDLAMRLAGPFAAVAEAIGGARPGDGGPQAPVRVGGAADLLAAVVVPGLAALISGGVRLQVVPGLSGPLVDSLRAGVLDLVVASERPRGRAVIATPVTDETFVLVAAPGVVRTPVAAPQDLEGTPLLAFAHDVPILRRYWRHVFGARLEREPALTVPDLRTLREAAIAGAGVTALPLHLCRDALESGRLVELHPTDDPPINTLFLVRRPGALAPHVERVRRAVSDAIARALA